MGVVGDVKSVRMAMATNPDLPRQSSVCSPSRLLPDPSKNMNMNMSMDMDMDDLLNSICSSSEAKTVDEVWKEIVSGTGTQSEQQQQQQQHMTLEDFLTKSVTVTATRGKKKRAKVVEEAVVDKATLQKQRRMIKNRESAARSRERKQAYTVELESLVIQLEQENARLSREQADNRKHRLKQLMECIIPVVEKRKPRRMLRRVNSVQW